MFIEDVEIWGFNETETLLDSGTTYVVDLAMLKGVGVRAKQWGISFGINRKFAIK